MKTLLVGGTGFSEMDYLENVSQRTVRTPYGGAVLYLGTYKDMDTGFLPRHGIHHEKLAPQVNYRANVWTARELGFRALLGTSAVASLNVNIQVGNLVIPDQLVDFSSKREESYFLGSVNMTEPFSPFLRRVIINSAREADIAVHEGATYLMVEGPRYETAAEIRLFQSWGMDVLGMTNGTEAALCRELDIHYATIGLVTNMGAGLTEEGPDLHRHRQVTQQNLPTYRRLALASLEAALQEKEEGIS